MFRIFVQSLDFMNSKLKRYFWLVDTLKDRPMSLNELREQWDKSIINDSKTTLSRRTFQEHKNAINTLDIGMEIVYNNRRYMLKSDNDDGNTIARWMWNMMVLQSAISQNTIIKDRIITDEIPSAHLYLNSILHAIKENLVIEFSYHPFGKSTFQVKFCSYFVQMTNQRWYVFGVKVGEEGIKSYALDRIGSIRYEEEHFSFPDDFSAKEYLSENGIGQYENIPVTDIIVRAYGKQVDVLRTFPLHPSQVETKTEDGKSEFTYRLRPSTKFYGDILSKGIYVKVLSPHYVRNKLKEITNKLSNYYK